MELANNFSIDKFDSNESFVAFYFIKHSNRSLFLTGKAGSGKSTLVELIKRDIKKNMIALAPTGVAAQNIAGQTIHSFFQLPYFGHPFPEDRSIEGIKFRKAKFALIQRLELIIIDEISMVHANMLDCIDLLLRNVRKCSEPFGGVQMLFVGDVFQLPPVVKKAEMSIYEERGYRSYFFFDAHSYKKAAPVGIELQKSFRQSDKKFLAVLDKIRDKSIRFPELYSFFRNKVVNIDPSSYEGIILTPRRKDADSINRERLDGIRSTAFAFKAEYSGDIKPSDCNVDENIVLKVGAKVMFIRNDPKKRYSNGTVGIVTSLGMDSIVIAIEGNLEIEVERYVWENKAEGEDSEVYGMLKQYPLRLAWAITIHKSQGMTFDKVHFDVGRSNLFAEGQAYVALSRVRSLDGLTMSRRIDRPDIKVSQLVRDFSSKINNEAATELFLEELGDLLEREAERAA